MRCLLVIILTTATQLHGRSSSLGRVHEDFRAIVETFCHNHSLLGNTLLVLESGRMVISLAERLVPARIVDLVANKVGLEIDDRGLVISAIAGSEPYYNQFEISGGKVHIHPPRYLDKDFLADNANRQLSFGGVIRGKRLELQQKNDRQKFTMTAVSDRLEITRETLHSWETGRGFPQQQRMKKLAEELSLDIGQLQRLRAQGKEDHLAQEVISGLERKVREEGITINEIETLKQFKQYMKEGMDLADDLAGLGVKVDTRFGLYYNGKTAPKRRTVAKLAEAINVDYDLLWKALIRDKLVDKFIQYNLVEHRYKFARPAIYEAFLKKLAVAPPPSSQQPTLNVDKEMEHLEITALDILAYNQTFSSLLAEHLALDEDIVDSSFEMFAYRSGISEEKLTNFIDGVSLPNQSEVEMIASGLLIETDELHWHVQVEKFLDICFEHLETGGKLISSDSTLPDAIKEILNKRASYL